ncbi:MAG: hypothetical protein ACI4J6_09330 [Oscillospiraceae bacterium]
MENNGMDFRETLLNQIKEYLDGKITKEEYYAMAEPFYTQYAHNCNNTLFLEYFLATIPDACLFYIDEPNFTSESNDEMFYKTLSEAYINLQKL